MTFCEAELTDSFKVKGIQAMKEIDTAHQHTLDALVE